MSPTSKTLRRPDDLIAAGLLPPERRAEIEAVAARYALAVTSDIAELIDVSDPRDPLARQFQHVQPAGVQQFAERRLGAVFGLVDPGLDLALVMGERRAAVGIHVSLPVKRRLERKPDGDFACDGAAARYCGFGVAGMQVTPSFEREFRTLVVEFA